MAPESDALKGESSGTDLGSVDPLFDAISGAAPDSLAEIESPLVSVVIPCYNHAHFLADAVESVLVQTHPHVEIVVVDDGSADETPDVARRYAEIRYERQDHRGLAAARNTGLGVSRGKYLVFLDADDRLLPDALEAGLECFRRHPESGFVSGSYRWIDGRGALLGAAEQVSLGPDPYSALLRGNVIAMHAAVMFRRDALQSIGGYNPDFLACEDYDVYLRITRLLPVHQHAGVVAEYRLHAGNMSKDRGLMLRSALKALNHEWTHAKRKGPSIEAHRAGIRYWIDTYGGGSVSHVAAGKIGASWKDAARGGLVLMRYVPQWFVRNTTKHLLHRSYRKVKWALPVPVRRRLTRRWSFLEQAPVPPVGRVRLGDFDRVDPVDRYFGFSRGLPVDRYYIEAFLERHAGDVRGCVLEIKDNAYTVRYGGERVTRSDVLDIDQGNPRATIVADLARAGSVASDSFDCVLLTQTLQLVYDVPAALRTVYRILKPGGVVLATLPGITKLDRETAWYWSFTENSARRLFEDSFSSGNVQIGVHGNVLAATAFLQGLAAEEMDRHDLDVRDPEYPVTITARARKPQQIA
jgi:SAM-dependent methyltransferase